MIGRDLNESSSRSSSTLHVIDGGILGARMSNIARKMQAGVGRPDPMDAKQGHVPARNVPLGSGAAVAGLRTYLPERIGSGYWDFIDVCPGFLLSVTDASYRCSHRMVLPAENIVKIRVVCSGTLFLASHDIRFVDGAVLMQRIGGGAPVEYLIEPEHSPLRMVVLHAFPAVLADLGVMNQSLPPALRAFLEPADSSDAIFPVPASATLLRIANDIIESRNRLVGELRQSYVRGKAYELLCEVVLRAAPIKDSRSGGNRFRHSDIVRLHEAKRILVSDLESSPTIDQLSRLVGINRTKLKAGFREVFGETIQQYRTRVRLTEALHLIEETDLPMAEIGRRIGFGHPANFTQVVKQRFGLRPLELRRKGGQRVEIVEKKSC